MSTDGAQLGIGAEAAMRAAIGGDEPRAYESAGEMQSRILATTSADAVTYDGCATYVAKLILLAYMADPSLAMMRADAEYDHSGGFGKSVKLREGMYDVLKRRLDPRDLEILTGISGFMWGWAVNAARRCVELPEVPNPAIITIG